MATIRDVGKLAGVSVATVSRVINNRGYVNEQTRKAVLQAMETLNYKPNYIARSLAGKKTLTIAFLVSDILNPFFPQMARSIEDEASKKGYSIVLCNSDNDAQKEREYLNLLKSKRFDGVIIASYTIQAEQILELQNDGLPVVVLDRIFPDYPILSLICRNRQGAEEAINHLVEQGCQNIAHISGPLDIYAARERALGFERVSRQYNRFAPSLISSGDFHIQGGYEAFLDLHAKHPDVDGVFAGNDLMAIGVMKALHELNKKIGYDVKIIGFDDIILSKMIIPELSTIRQPISAMSQLAVELLMKQINSEQVEIKTYHFEVELVVRASSKPI